MINKVEELKQKGKEACEKSNYELYKMVCCELHMYVKICPPFFEVEASSTLYDLLTNTKSEEFLDVVKGIIMDGNDVSCADAIIYYLLLSVRTDDPIEMAVRLNMCDTIQDEIFNRIEQEEKSEKRE